MTLIYSAPPVPEVSLKSNIITHHGLTFDHIQLKAQSRGITQFSVYRSGGSDQHPLYDMSYAMRTAEHAEFAGLIHRQNAENKLKQKVDKKGGKPDNTNPDGTPPEGGTPGSTKQVEFVDTIAIAA